MRMKRIIAITTALLAICTGAAGQSKSFSLGKWTEINNAILKELNRNYVDSLPVDRIERKAVDAMLADLDPYTVYVPVEEDENLQMMVSKSYGGIGAIIYKPEKDGYIIINEPYENSPAAQAGLHCGDRIMAVDGKSSIGMTAAESSSAMKGTPGTDVTLTVKKVWTGEVVDLKINRKLVHIPDIEYYGMINESDGYIIQTGFTDGVGEQVRAAVLDLKKQGMKRLVYDLRGNGGGLLNEAVNIVSLFIPEGSVVVTSKGNDAVQNYTYTTTGKPIDTELPILILVDSGSASASEILSGALQDYDRATIAGTRTYGKGLVQTIRPLPYGGKLKITTAKYYTPSGRCVQAIDYSNRNEDGSVGHIPDSLTHEFKTASGRIVRDGGGITPDTTIVHRNYSRLTYSVVLGGVLDQYVIDFVERHPSIPELKDFHFSDEDYEDFIAFASTKEFDYRSSAKTYYDKMVEELREDNLADAMSSQLEALDKALNMEKETFLRLKKSELIPFIEEDIAVRYYFQKAGAQIRLRYDEQLRKALSVKPIKAAPAKLDAAPVK